MATLTYAAGVTGPAGYTWASNAAQATATSTVAIWPAWAYGAMQVTTSANTTCGVWPNWVGIAGAYEPTTGTISLYTDPPQWNTWAEETQEQREVRAELARQEIAKMEEDKRKKAEAKARAKELLKMMLDAKQQEQLERHGFFEVLSSRNNRFRIQNGTHGNVIRLLDDGKPAVSFCGQPVGVLDEDAMLAQKLMIECHEEEYIRISNPTMLLEMRVDSEQVRAAQAIIDESMAAKRRAPVPA